MSANKVFDHPPEHRSKLKNLVCRIPHSEMQIYEDGQVSSCCYSWLPTYTGNVNQNSLYEILQNSVTRDVQMSTLDGSYRFCDSQLCPELSAYLSMGRQPWFMDQTTPNFEDDLARQKQTIYLYLNYDKSCNLECPSCRSGKILFNDKTVPESLRRTHQNVVSSIQDLMNRGFTVELNVTGSGDPFASPLYFELLSSIKPEHPIKIGLQTNGVLMTSERLSPTLKSKLKWVNVSVDAATEDTYRIVRKGGRFAALQKNLRDFDRAIKAGEYPKEFGWQVNLVVQTENYREIPAFAKWGLGFETLSKVWFNNIADWGHLDRRVFEDKAVWREEHPYHQHFLSQLKDDVLLNERIQLGSLAPYVARARATSSSAS